MPQAASRKQYRMMMAILHGQAKDGPRGRPPKSVAAKYTAPGKDSAESKHNDKGGTWGESHHKKAKEKVKADRKERKKTKKELKKSFEEFYKGQAAATLVVDANNRVLLGTHSSGGLAFPGGHIEPNEDVESAALRELKEEAGVVGRLSTKIYSGKQNGNHVDVYLAEIATGKLKGSEELSNLKWYEANEIPWDKIRDCCVEPLKEFVTNKLGKSLKGMLALETLEKNIIRQRGDAVFEVTHGDALKLVGNGVFRALREAVRGMTDEDFKEVQFDTHKVFIRRHMSDVYSGRVSDGHKIVYQFTNKSLPELTAALMSVFEWYLPEDEKELMLLDDGALSDDAIAGGMNELVENYRKHNIGNIYQEMETIREQLRNGVAVDLQQVEARIMTLFDKLESTVHDMAGKHNDLVQAVGKDMDELESKLRDLQSRIESVSRKPEVVHAIATNPANKDAVHDAYYSYLPKPKIEILPNGKITISFSQDWQDMEKQNFLNDMRAKVITKAGKGDV